MKAMTTRTVYIFNASRENQDLIAQFREIGQGLNLSWETNNHKHQQGQRSILCVKVSATGASATAMEKWRRAVLLLLGVSEECPECAKCHKWESEWKRTASDPRLSELIDARFADIDRQKAEERLSRPGLSPAAAAALLKTKYRS
jgi:hypothetical protein